MCLAALVLLSFSPAFGQEEPPDCGEVTNPFSAFPITVDGQFTPGGPEVGVAVAQGIGTEEVLEWSDVEPLAFISPVDPEGTLFRTCQDDPAANSFLYTAIAIGGGGEEGDETELYLSL